MAGPQDSLTLNFIHFGGCHRFPQLTRILFLETTENCRAWLALVSVNICGPSQGLKLHGKYSYDIGFSISVHAIETTTQKMTGT